MKTAELEGALLDYWVAKAEGLEDPTIEDTGNGEGPLCYYVHHHDPGDDGWWTLYGPTRDWSLGGPIIDRLRMNFATIGTGPRDEHGNEPIVAIGADSRRAMQGPTHLIAAMRAFVASVYGDTVPDDPAPSPTIPL